MEVIKNNLPKLTAFCGMQPYQGAYDYTSLDTYFKEAEKILSQRCNKLALQGDAVMSRLIREKGKDAVLDMKRSNCNTKLEDCVMGADQQRMLDIIDNQIVPRTGLIFLTPQSNIGRAPFYCCEKIIAGQHVKTLWFNMAVLLMMSVVMTVLLMTDCPGRYLRK